MKSAQDDRLLSANDVINLIFKMAPRLIKRVYNCLGLTDEDNSVSRTDNFVNVNVFNSVTFARVLSYRWVLHYFSTIPVGRIKIVTIYKRSIFQVEWLIATLILCISHCSESDSVSNRVFYSAVSTAPRFLLVLSVSRPKLPLGHCFH